MWLPDYHRDLYAGLFQLGRGFVYSMPLLGILFFAVGVPVNDCLLIV